MRRILAIGTLMLIATPALASRPPITTNSVTFYQPQEASNGPVSRVRRHHIRHARSRAVHGYRHAAVKEVMRHREHKAPTAAPAPAPLPLPDATETLMGSVTASLGEAFEGFMDGMAMPRPQVIAKRPKLLTGELTINGKKFAYASGGRGWSIPYGTVEITPADVGPWGKRHGAIGLSGDSIYDKQLGRDREGIEIHEARHMASAGCVVVEEFDQLKRAIFAMIETVGHAYLHVGPSGAAITPTKESPLPPIIYLAERVADEERHSEDRHEHKHRRIAENLPHRKYAHHRHTRIAKA